MRHELSVWGPVILILVAGYLATTFYDTDTFSGFSSLSGAAVVAKDQCPADKTLFKVSAKENAHAELATENNYNFAACWDGQGSTNRKCDGKNAVLRLSADTNAHVEGPTQKTYPKEVCFGSLDCKLSDKGTCSTLGAAYKCVASLSGQMNAHVADCGFYNLDLCCSDGALGGGGQPMKDTDGDGIWDDGDLRGIGNNYCNPASNDPKRKNLKICDDNCIDIKNADQVDTDNDGAGDACDAFKDDSCSIKEKDDNCKFKSECKNLGAKWGASTVQEGDAASLTVTGSSECADMTVSFKVIDNKDKNLLTQDPQPVQLKKGTTESSASSTWKGEYHAKGSNTYYFQATVVGGKTQVQITSPQSPPNSLLTVTKAPGARCGNGKVEGSNNEECDDGNTKDTDACSNTCKLNGNFTRGGGCPDDPANSICAGVPSTFMVCKSDVTQAYFCLTGPNGCKKLSTPMPCGKVGGVQQVCMDGATACKPPVCQKSCSPWSPCVNGKQTSTCTITGGSHCGSLPLQERSCVEKQVEEPFPVFTWSNVLVTILLLITFYTFRRGGRWKSR